MTRVVAVIPARGGSRGIPKKNLSEVCGHPLIAWSIRQLLASSVTNEVYVSSDSNEILQIAESYGAKGIMRPDAISGDEASSELAWLHALEVLDASGPPVSLLLAVQATSPIRDPEDFAKAVAVTEEGGFDSVLSCCELKDHFIWRIDQDGEPNSENYDWRNRRRRQDIETRYLENGSFFVLRPAVLREGRNRLGGRIGLYVMSKHKQFQIDEPEDVLFCEAVMRGYGLDRLP